MSLNLEPLLTETQAAALLGRSPRTLQFHRRAGVGAPYVKLSPTADAASGAIRYRRAGVEAYRRDSEARRRGAQT